MTSMDDIYKLQNGLDVNNRIRKTDMVLKAIHTVSHFQK